MIRLSVAQWDQVRKVGFVLGLGVIVFGYYQLQQSTNAQSAFAEIPLTEDFQETSFDVVVDIAGAVTHPGVYKMDNMSRVEDVLVKAGGIDEEADMDWVEQTLNRARRLEDGEKIYIPFSGEPLVEDSVVPVSQTLGVRSINVNKASKEELVKLYR